MSKSSELRLPRSSRRIAALWAIPQAATQSSSSISLSRVVTFVASALRGDDDPAVALDLDADPVGLGRRHRQPRRDDAGKRELPRDDRDVGGHPAALADEAPGAGPLRGDGAAGDELLGDGHATDSRSCSSAAAASPASSTEMPIASAEPQAGQKVFSI